MASIEEVRKERLKEILKSRKLTESRLTQTLAEIYNKRKLKKQFAMDKLLLSKEDLKKKHGNQAYYKIWLTNEPKKG